MADWDSYPNDYRAEEVERIRTAVRAGESVSLVGLSGAGKSNLLGFLEHQGQFLDDDFVLADANRLAEATPAACWRMLAGALGADSSGDVGLNELEALIARRLRGSEGSLAILFDRFDVLTDPPQPALYNNLRVLRDAHKYRLAFVVATRRPLDPASELAELFYAHTLWLGPLSDSDAKWNVQRYARRIGAEWGETTVRALLTASGRYPSLLRAACEAHAAGTPPDVEALAAHPAVQRRVAELWLDAPDPEALQQSGLTGIRLLQIGRPHELDTANLTGKEALLLEYLRANAGQICAKDDIIQAVWPEDRIYDAGIRDDSLAQLVRRLRVKIEPDPAKPQFIQTAPGRGYVFKADA